MEPIIIQMNELFIAGLTGNVTETEKVWNEIELQFDKNPFQKIDDNIYKIHFFDGINNVNPQKEIHVGYLVENCNVIDNFSIIKIPASEYAVFDVFVSNGYDSENNNMEKWLLDNNKKYSQIELNGNNFVIECYNEKFNGGDKPDSIVEIWIPIKRL